MALTLVTSDLIGGLDYSKLTGTVPTWNQNTTGSAATLTTARNIGGVSFNGSAAINLPGVNAAGNQNTSGTAAGLSATLAVGSGGTGVTSITALKNVLDDETWTFANNTTFGGSVTADQGIFDSTANTYAGGSLILRDLNGANPMYLTSVVGSLAISNGGSADHLLIASSGLATFSHDIELSRAARTTIYASSSNQGVQLKSNGSGVLQLNADGGGNVTICENGGNVGIGISSPGAQFHNYSTATTNVFISGHGTSAQNNWAAGHAFFVKAENGIIIGKANANNNTNRLYTFYNDTQGNAEQYIYNTSNVATIVLDSAGNSYFNGGNVGIGTTSPAGPLDVFDSNGRLFLAYGGGQTYIANHSAYNAGSGSDNRLIFQGRYRSSYNDETNLGEIRVGKDAYTDGYYGGNMQFHTRINGGAMAERMRIMTDGTVLFNKNSNALGTVGYRFDVAGESYFTIASGRNTLHVFDGTNGAWRFYVTSTGQIYAGATSINSLSDVSLKENIKTLETGLDEIIKLKPRRFDFKDDDRKNVAGFIAQEVEEVLPDLVSEQKYNETENKKCLKMGDMIPTLVKAIQEQQDQIELLKQEVELLKNK